MSYQALDINGQAVTLAKNDRITSIKGQPTNYFVDEVKPERSVTSDPMLKTWEIQLQPTSLVNGVVTSSTSHTLEGQVKFKKQQKQSGEKGANAPCTDGYFLIHNANPNDEQVLLRVFFAESQDAQSYPNAFELKMVLVTVTGADDDAGKPGTRSENAILLPFKEIELKEQIEARTGQSFKDGDLRAVVHSSYATLAQLRSAGWFTVAALGQPAEKYTLVNGGSLQPLVNTHYELILKRKAQ